MLAAALEAGVLVLSAGERVVRLLPPLVIGQEVLDEGLSILGRVLGRKNATD